MAARIVHFGPDECHRLFVLRSAGYDVGQCGSVVQLRTELLSGRHTDAIVMPNGQEGLSHDAIEVARSHSSARLVLFRDTNGDAHEEEFDLVIPPLTPPIQWLSDIAILMEQSRMIRAAARRLAWESAALRSRSRRERARSEELRRPSAEKLAGNWGLEDCDDGDEHNNG